MGNFFKELADIEEVVLVKKYYVTPVGESIYMQKFSYVICTACQGLELGE
jgi:hypothetical protein